MKKIFLRSYILLFILQITITVLFSVTTAEQASQVQKYRNRILISTEATIPAGRISLYQSEPSTRVATPTSLAVQVDSGGAAINTVGLTFYYPIELIEIKEIILDDSFCTIVVENQFNNVEGFATVECGLPNPGAKVQISTIATIRYLPLKAGTAIFHIEPVTASLLLNDGLGTNSLKATEDISILITDTEVATQTSTTSTTTTTTTTTEPSATAKPTSTATPPPITKPSTAAATPQKSTRVATPQRPPLSAASHPSSLQCSSLSEATFSWLKAPGVTSFEYEFNTSPSTFKNPTATTETQITLPTVPGTNQYFHVRALTGSIKGSQSVTPIITCATPEAVPEKKSVSQEIIRDALQPIRDVVASFGRFMSSIFSSFR